MELRDPRNIVDRWPTRNDTSLRCHKHVKIGALDDLKIVHFKLFSSAIVGNLKVLADILSTAAFNVLD